MFDLPTEVLLGPVRAVEAARIEPIQSSSSSLEQAWGQAPNVVKEIVEMAAQKARKFAVLAGQASVSDEIIDQIHADVGGLALAYPRQPLPAILGELVDIQDAVFTILEGRTPPNQARQVYFLAGVTSGLLAEASHDLADAPSAAAQARTAFVCAEQADHNGLRAWVRGLQALVAYWAGRPQESVRYAQSGGAFADLAGSTTTVWLPISEARSWAMLGNSQNALAALEKAERSWDRVTGDELDEMGGICTFGRTRQMYYAADALTWLPTEVGAAETYAAQAVEAYRDTDSAEWAFGDQAGSHADLAVARVMRGELDGAVEALSPVLELPTDQRNNGIIASAQRVRETLLRSRLVNDSRQLQDRIETFTRSPVAAIPR